MLGVITVGEDAQDNAVDATGAFIRYSSDIAINLINPLYTPQLDVCSVDMINVSDLPTDFPVTNVATEIVSAGEVIPFTSSAGSYIQLLRQNQSGFQYYAPQPETVSGPIPGSLTVDIPGDVFPAFANLSMPTVQPLTLNSPTAGQPITPTSSFSWTQGTNNNAYVSITASAANAAGVMIVECNVNDDGDFSFPAQTQSDMGSTFISIGVDYDRVAHSVQQQGNALVVLTTTSGN